MGTDLPIGTILKEAAAIHWQHRMLFLATAGVFALLLFSVIAFAAEPYMAFLEQVGTQDPEQLVPIDFGPIFAAILLGLVVVAATFVFWTRLSLMGLQGALENGWLDWIRQIGATLVNFLFIGVVQFLAIGLLVGLLLQAISPDALARLQAGSIDPSLMLLLTLVLNYAASLVFAFFSFNLVEGAIGERYVSSSLSRSVAASGVGRMSVLLFSALMGLTVMNQIIFWVDRSMPGTYTMMFLSLVVMVLFTTYLAALHGIAFRIRTGRRGPMGSAANSP